jgi:hypothetical protein
MLLLITLLRDTFGALHKCGIDGTVTGCGWTGRMLRGCGLYVGDDLVTGGQTLGLVTGG